MGLIDEAIALEERAETTYRGAAEVSTDPTAVRILTLLADEEARHADALRTMNAGNLQTTVSLIDVARDWIGGAVEGGAVKISSDTGLHDVLQRAMEIEAATARFYREKAVDAESREIATLFERLAGIENAHYLFVGSLVEYFDRPSEWIESAEFGLRDEY